MPFRLFAPLLLAACLWPQLAHSAWTQKRGNSFTAQTTAAFRSTHYYDDNGTKTAQPAYVKYEQNSYFEHGLTDASTLGLNLFIQQIDTPSASQVAVADTEIFLRQRLWHNERAVLSFQPLLKFPTWHSGDRLLTGTDDFDLEARMLGGYGFDAYGRHHYVIGELAYRKRLGEWRDQLKADLTLGWRLTRRITFHPQLSLTQRVEGTARSTASNAAVNDYDLIKGEIAAIYDWNEKTSVRLGVFSHLRARNTGDGEGVRFSIWKRF